MVASLRDGQISTPDPPAGRAQTWLFTLALLALVVGTVAGVLLARHRAGEALDRRAEDAADRAAALLENELADAVSGLSGAAAVVSDDGGIELATFEAFAADLLDTGEVDSLLLAAVDPSGADELVPVVAIAPGGAGPALVGADLGRDPARAAVIRQAVRTREPAVSEPLELLVTAEAGIAVVRPLLARASAGDEVVGVVDTGIPLDRLTDALQEAAGSTMEVALVDEDDEVVAGPAVDPRQERTRVRAEVPGQRWWVSVHPTGRPDRAVAWLVGAGGGAAILTMAALLTVTVRHQRRLGRANEALGRAEERSRAGQEVAGRLARALSGGDVAAAIFDHLPAAVGARSAFLATADRSGQLWLVEPGPATSGGEASGPRTALGTPAPGSVLGDVLARDQAAWLSSPLGWRDDEVITGLAGAGRALAVLPLAADDVAGVLGVRYEQFHIFGDDEQALLQTVAVLAGQALARGRRYDAEHEAAVAFQQAALPDELPSVRGAAVAARYRPATRGATVGGDWYDVLALDADRVLLVVGDVVGHGMVAAAAMGRLRTAFQTIVAFDDDPGGMLRTVSEQVETIPDAFAATVLAAVVDLRTGSMRWCRAGHPPPLLVRAGTHEVLDATGLPPLGVAPEKAPPVHHCDLRAGDLLVLYTDGLVERRTESVDRSFHRLGLVVEELVDLELEELCDTVVEAMVPAEEQTDDLAVLVLRYEGLGR